MNALLSNAADLLSDDGANLEYDRAIIELTCRLLGVSTECRDSVEEILREMKS